MTCEHCAKAAVEIWHGFHSACVGCRARQCARSPGFSDSKHAGSLTDGYLSLLTIALVSHDEVKAAAMADVMTAGAASAALQAAQTSEGEWSTPEPGQPVEARHHEEAS